MSVLYNTVAFIVSYEPTNQSTLHHTDNRTRRVSTTESNSSTREKPPSKQNNRPSWHPHHRPRHHCSSTGPSIPPPAHRKRKRKKNPTANKSHSACIAYKSTILTEHTTSAGSATSSLASLILPKIDHSSPQKLTYTHGANHIHYISDAGAASPTNAPGLTYLVIAKQELGRRIPFGFLVEIKKRFLAAHRPSGSNSGSGSGSNSSTTASHDNLASLPAYGAAAFNGELRALMVDFGTTKAGQDDAFRNVQGEIANVRDIMSQNIEQVLERGERIDLLVDKTDRLGGSARDFRVRSRGLQRRMWWKNVKLMVMLVFVVLFLVYLLVGFGCGLPGES